MKFADIHLSRRAVAVILARLTGLFPIVFAVLFPANILAQTVRPLVLVSVPPQQFVVERLAGDLVEAKSIVPTIASHGSYEPTMVQLKLIAAASLYVKVGHPLFGGEDQWVRKGAEQNPQMIIVDGSEGISKHSDDPHTWVSPKSMLIMAENISRGLCTLLVDRCDQITTNKSSLLTEIRALDSEFTSMFEQVKRREFMVFHPAWGYFATDYGLTQLAIEREGKEPDAAEVARLVAYAKLKGIRTIFAQPQYSAAIAQVMAEEIGARIEVIDPFGQDWFTNIRYAAREIHKALQ